jgi:hypothetical protein
MSEREKSKFAKKFKHACDESYAKRLATSDLISLCRTAILKRECTAQSEGRERPPEGATVMLFDQPDGIAVVADGDKVGTIDGNELPALRPLINEVGGIVTAIVTRHAVIGDSFAVEILDPLGGLNAPGVR